MNKKLYKETFDQITMSQESIEKLKQLEYQPRKKNVLLTRTLRYAAVFLLTFMIADVAVYAASGSGIIQRVTAVINGKSYQVELEKKTDEHGDDYYVGHIAGSETEDEKENTDGSAEADSSTKQLFAINEITGQMNAALEYLDPKLHYEEAWTVSQMAEYLGVDVIQCAKVFPDNYEMEYLGSEKSTVIYENNGKLTRDRAYYEFIGKDGRKITVLTSKLGMPYDTLYQLDTNQQTTIRLQNGDYVELLVAAQDKSDTTMEYGFYVIDFEYDGVYYRITGENIEAYRLDGFIRQLLK